MDAELEKLLDEIQGGSKSPSKPPLNKQIQTLGSPITALPMSRLVEADLSDFILSNTKNIVENGVNVISDLKSAISQTIDPDEISALADIIKSTNGSIEILNKIHLQNKKLSGKTDGNTFNSKQTNVFVGTRQEILDNVINNKAKKDSIDVEFKDETPSKILPKEKVVATLEKEIQADMIAVEDNQTPPLTIIPPAVTPPPK